MSVEEQVKLQVIAKERELRLRYKNIFESHKAKIRKECEQELFMKVKTAENDIKIARAELAREKSQLNVFRADVENRLSNDKKKLKKRIEVVTKKQNLVDVEARKLKA